MELVTEEGIAKHMDAISKIGKDPDGGFTRAPWSDEESEAHEYFVRVAKENGLQVIRDAAGNLYVKAPGNVSGVVQIGSHLDTVPNGGNFDGVAGIAAGMEAILAAKDEPRRKDLELVIWRGEESSFFNMAYLGSRLALGAARPNILERTNTCDGKSLEDAIRGQGFDVGDLRKMIALGGTFPGERFVTEHFELHIEQGNLLEKTGYDLGLVRSIRGPHRLKVQLQGDDSAAHAAQLITELERQAYQAAKAGNDLVQTFGVINAFGGCDGSPLASTAMNKVAGYAEAFAYGARTDEIFQADTRINTRFGVEVFQEQHPEGVYAKFHGRFDHSGATPMGLPYRRDANLAAAHWVAGMKELYPDMSFTINNTGEDTRFLADIRSTELSFREAYVEEAIRIIQDFSSGNGIQANVEIISQADPIEELSPRLRNIMEQGCNELDYMVLPMQSGAGHDVAIVTKQTHADTGLIFIPCREGISHSPLEHAEVSDIAKGANVLAYAIAELAR
ncbi:M20/M25/M40 family metallo-hydrolase [Nanoarchaeota archaeon]